MTAIHDFVEDWIEIRARLQRQLRLLETNRTGAASIGAATEPTILRLRKWIEELNELLKECAAADRT